jgi:hypothetical protein
MAMQNNYLLKASRIITENTGDIGARGRNRTGTPIRREILSLLCLPISPPGRMEGVHQIAVRILTLTGNFSSTFHRYLEIFLYICHQSADNTQAQANLMQ